MVAISEQPLGAHQADIKRLYSLGYRGTTTWRMTGSLRELPIREILIDGSCQARAFVL